MSPFACLYDLLQFGFGHLNGFESSRLDAGRESVVDARAVDEDATAPEVDAPALEEDAWALGATLLYPVPPGLGEATREDAGVLSGVLLELLLRSSAVGAHTACPLWAFIGPSVMLCCCMNIALGPEPSVDPPGRRLE